MSWLLRTASPRFSSREFNPVEFFTKPILAYRDRRYDASADRRRKILFAVRKRCGDDDDLSVYLARSLFMEGSLTMVAHFLNGFQRHEENQLG
jgi:hypothetical protein